MPISGIRPSADRLFVEQLDMPAQIQSEDQLVLAQVDSVGPEVKGIKAGDTVMVRSSSLASALTFNELKLIFSWDVIATM